SQESRRRCRRSLATGTDGFKEMLAGFESDESRDRLRNELHYPGPERLWYVGDAFRAGYSVEDVHELTKIDPWFLAQIEEIILAEKELLEEGIESLTGPRLRELKRMGFADSRLATLLGVEEGEIRALRHRLGVRPVYKRVDSCAAEFPSSTAYMYSTYEEECEAEPTDREKIIVLGGGPNRIGQGIEFDYC